MPFRPEVFIEGKWSRNGLVFATREEAAHSASRLFRRWTLCESYRAIKTDESVNARIVSGELEMIQRPVEGTEQPQQKRSRLQTDFDRWLQPETYLERKE